MSYRDAIQQLKRYDLISGKFICDDDETDFAKILNVCSLESPMNPLTNIEDIKLLSENVKKQILYNQFIISNWDYIYTMDELLEYGNFYYYNSPYSPGSKKQENNIEIIEKEFSDELKSLKETCKHKHLPKFNLTNDL